MPRDGAIIFGDLIGKLDMLHLACDKCGRKGRYAVARLIEQRGHDAKVVDLLAEITANCPKKQAGNMSDQCAARCPDLPRVMSIEGSDALASLIHHRMVAFRQYRTSADFGASWLGRE